MNLIFEVEIPMLPPSDNKYKKPGRFGGFYLTKEAEAFHRIAAQYVIMQKKLPSLKVIQDAYNVLRTCESQSAKKKLPRINLSADVIYYGEFLTAAGHWRKRDTTNLNKVLFDAVMPVLGLDDSLIQHTTQRKVDSPVDKCLVRIYELTGGEC